MRSARRRGAGGVPEAVFWSVPIVLFFLPTLYYSLTTPFGLVDDISLSRYATFFAAEELLAEPFRPLRHPDRYRPFWDFYNGVTWTVFGPVPWLHHLARWLTVAGAVFAFTAAFSAFPSAAPAGRGAASAFIRLLPRALLVWLWVFFPNQPAARLAPQEVNTVFFMGLCTWMTARLLVHGEEEKPGSARLTHGLFVLGFFGLVWSKETNLGVALWMLIFHCAPLLRGMDRARIASGLAVTAVFAHTAWVISRLADGQGYGTASVTPTLFTDNAGWIAAALFQVETSPVIAAGLAVLSALLAVFVVAKADLRMSFGRRRPPHGAGGHVVERAGLHMSFNSELLFVLFLLGQFASLYLVLCTSWTQAPRYWYSLVPVFTTLLAFSAKFLLEFLAQPAPAAGRLLPGRLPAACTLAGFVVFFIGCNYSHALFQTVVQHRARHTEKTLLAEVTRLLDRGAYVRVLNFDSGDELTENIVNYYRDFLPRLHGREYDIYDLHIRVGPFPDEGPRYGVTHTGDLPPSHELADDYRLLSYARDAAAFLQGGDPHWIRDWGVGRRRWYVVSTDPSYGKDGLMQAGPDGMREPAGEVALDTRFDNSMTRYIREHSIAGSLFTNDLLVEPLLIRGHGSAPLVHDGLPCLDDLPSAESPHDIHIAWFFNSDLRWAREECVDPAVPEQREARWWRAEDGVLEVNLADDTYRAAESRRKGVAGSLWQWQRADAMPDDSRVPDGSTWSDVDDGWVGRRKYRLSPDDMGKFLRAHVVYEKAGQLTRTESAVIGPIVAPRPGYVTRNVIDLWSSPELELVAEAPEVLIFKFARSGVDPTGQARYEAVAPSGEPVIDAFFDVYLHDGELTYVKEDGCTAELTRPLFFLHVFPFSARALPPSQRDQGYESFEFAFERSGLMSDGKCLMTVPFPSYAVNRIRAGQYIHYRGDVWQGEARWSAQRARRVGRAP